MRTNSITSLGHVAVVAKNLKTDRKVVSNQPSINRSVLMPKNRKTVLVPVAFDVVYGQKFQFFFATAVALAAIMLDYPSTKLSVKLFVVFNAPYTSGDASLSYLISAAA